MARKVVFLLAVFGWILLNAPSDSLWYDETVNAYLATHSWSTLWEWSTRIDNQVPLHFVALKIWVGLLGRSEFALRLFSYFCAWLAAAGIMALGKRLAGNGWLATFFFIASGAFLYAAGEVRTYALALALLTWSSVFLWELWRRPQSPRLFPLISYLVLAILLTYTHYTAWLGIAAQFVFMLVRIWKTNFQGKKLLAIIASGWLVGALAWLVALSGRDFNAGTAFEGYVTVEDGLKTYLNFYVFGQKLFTDQATTLALIITGVTAFFAVTWLLVGTSVLSTTSPSPKMQRFSLENIALAFALTLIPLIAMTYSVNQIEAKLSGRHTWVMWPGMALLVAGGVQSISQFLPRRWLRWGLVALIAALPIRALLYMPELDEHYRGDFRQAFAILQREASPDDLLVLQDGTLFTTAEYYQSTIAYVGVPQDQLTNVNKQVQLHEAWDTITQHLLPDAKNIWVLSWQGDTMDPTGLAFAIPEYLTDGQRTIWLAGDDNEVVLVEYRGVQVKLPLPEHIAQYPGILQVPPDGPSLLGYDVFKILPDSARAPEDCAIIIHSWWWRGETDYPLTMMGVRLTDENDAPLVQRDLPPAGYHFGQEKWQSFIPVLGRIELPYDCREFEADVAYRVQMAVYDFAGEKPTQPVLLDSFTLEN